MMKLRFLLSLVLMTVLLAACAPAASSAAPAQTVVDEPDMTLASATPTPQAPIQPSSVPTETLAPTPLPIATSRGPNLEATDPSTVNLASGGLQLVEFFRFT